MVDLVIQIAPHEQPPDGDLATNAGIRHPSLDAVGGQSAQKLGALAAGDLQFLEHLEKAIATGWPFPAPGDHRFQCRVVELGEQPAVGFHQVMGQIGEGKRPGVRTPTLPAPGNPA